jgi:NADH-quinone oxidoreductase subunit B
MGIVERGLVPRPVATIAAQARRWSLWALPLGRACCAGELEAALRSPRVDATRVGVTTVDDPAAANVLIVGGPLLAGDQRWVSEALDALAHPRYVMAVGACALSGGPFRTDLGGWCGPVDASAGVPVDVYVPGCPPTAEALLYGVIQLQNKIRRTNTIAR